MGYKPGPSVVKTLREELIRALEDDPNKEALRLLAHDAALKIERINWDVPLESRVQSVLQAALGAGDEGLRKLLTRIEERYHFRSDLLEVREALEKLAGPFPFPEGPRAPTGVEQEILVYSHALANLHRCLEIAGFARQVRVPLGIEALYVPLRAMMDLRAVGESRFGSAEEAETCLREETLEIPLIDAFRAPCGEGRKGLVILGDPGSGKTTHLKRLVLFCLREGSEGLGLPAGMLPVFLPLRELHDLRSGLDAFVEAQLAGPHFKVPGGFGRRLLERGNLLFLLDGLDGVADEGQRGQVSRWIEAAVPHHETCRFVVTSRFAGYTGDARLQAEFLELHIRPLNREQAEQFVRGWYRIVEEALSEDLEQGRRKGEARAEELLESLRQPEFRASRVFEMTRNPLLLANLCLVHRDRGNLPQRRAGLYEDCIEVLLEKWRSAKGLGTVPAKTGRNVLQPAALWLHRQPEQRTRASAAELSEAIGPALQANPGLAGDAEGFLEKVRDESGLLTGWSEDQFGFMHLGFQEFLAARELRNRSFGEPELLQELAAHFGESWWQEVTLLLLAIEEQPAMFEPFMRELVKLPQMEQFPHLLEECFEEASGISPEPFVELVEASLGRGSGVRDPWFRRLLARLVAWIKSVGLLRGRRALPGAVDTPLWSRELTALKLLERHFPETLAEILPGLGAHPSEVIRNWARQQQAEAAQPVIWAPRGGYELVPIPGGDFDMGSPEEEEERFGWEGPVHRVRVPSFYMGRYPVTNEEYGRFLKENPGLPEPEYWSEGRFNQARQPVVGVSWDEAKEYAEWAGLRLPSEAEWEYACRAGTTTRYYNGENESDLAKVAWYEANSGGKTHPVGEKVPNRFGLYDMLGNVYEWVEDDVHLSYIQAPTDGSAWVDDPRGSYRVGRGGSWSSGARFRRVACRWYWFDPSARRNYVGFRLSRST